MSLPEALKMGLSLLQMYRQSSGFDHASKRIENEDKYKRGVIDRLDGIISVTQARR